MMPEQAQTMVDKILQMEVFHELAKREINLTGGEPSQNPHIVEIFKIFRKLTPNVRIHTNLDINSAKSQRWLRLVEIMKLSGRVDFTLYPTVWEARQKPLLIEILGLQDELIVNMIFEKVSDLLSQIEILMTFFGEQEKKFQSVLTLLETYRTKLESLLSENPECNEDKFLKHMEGTENYICTDNFTFGMNMIPGFYVDKNGERAMNAQPFPKDFNLLECTIPRGTIEIVTVQQTGEITPCCDVGNLKCQPKFGNLLMDSPVEIMQKVEVSRKKMVSGIQKNHQNINNGKAGEWVEEGIPPYCV
ncbi:MAG: radical SAM protein [Nitrospina sp.]|nr:radical SAM protein [Nitrospina sp.]MBT5551119.1 radical SAM protein [Nitrospina sp.]